MPPVLEFRRGRLMAIQTAAPIVLGLVGLSTLAQQGVTNAIFGGTFVVLGFGSAWHLGTSGRVRCYEARVRVASTLWRRTFTRAEIDHFGLVASRSGYGGAGETLAIFLRNGSVRKVGEFWQPNVGQELPIVSKKIYPDCARIAAQLNAWLIG